MTGPNSLFHRNLRVALLGGGTSAEREISLASAAAVRRALTTCGHEVWPLDPAEVDLQAVPWAEFDVAVLALHGTDGEDGTVQRILANAGIPFTGSHAEASELAFSKSAAKERFREVGVPTPGHEVVHEGDHASRIRTASQAVGFPLVVKPDRQGSSLGVTLVREPEQLSRALIQAFSFGEHCVLEAYVAGSEWTVSVIDELVLPLVRIDAAGEFYDFESKYESSETVYTPGATLPAAVANAIREAGVAACRAIGTSGIARADIRLDARNQPWVLEVNTLPGMTDQSLVPKAAAHSGIAFEELCERTIACALSSQPERVRQPGEHRSAA